jgi:wyosine [tRNA(Phe)-imidazoG37] synthetase (radical SAM superfamily)
LKKLNFNANMSTVIYPSPIFGPVHSRRLGISLGINLLPGDGKICNFDCIYCECGFNEDKRPHSRMPSRALVNEKLREKLEEMKAAGQLPDTLTFAGNGEPTGHPEFAEIIDDVIALRAEYAPKAKISVLTNATHILKDSVFKALLKVDNALLKLDTVDADYIRFVDRPTSRYDLPALIGRMKEFKGRCVIQSMFMKGSWEGRSVDNTTERYVGPWLKAIADIRPRFVTVYTIDRETPDADLRKATHEELDGIAARVRALGIDASVSY